MGLHETVDCHNNRLISSTRGFNMATAKRNTSLLKSNCGLMAVDMSHKRVELSGHCLLRQSNFTCTIDRRFAVDLPQGLGILVVPRLTLRFVGPRAAGQRPVRVARDVSGTVAPRSGTLQLLRMRLYC